MGLEGMERESRFEVERGELTVLGGKVETVDVRPEHLRIERPVLVAPGWSETPETFKDSLEVIANDGRRAFAIKHARYGGDVSGLNPELREKFPKEELRKALALVSMLVDKDIESADAIGHSEGGYNVLIAAAIAPEHFRNIVLANPAGIIGKDTFPALFQRFTGAHIKMGLRTLFGLKSEADPGLFRIQKETVKEFTKNPMRALKEAVAISRADTVELIQELRHQGINIAIMANVDDPVFPMDRIQQTLQKNQLDGFLSLRGEHYDINTNAPRYTKAALGLLDQLEAKRDK